MKSSNRDSNKNAEKYALSGIENTYYLGYRDIPFLIQKYVSGKKAIDYGCGTGRSTRFLRDIGMYPIGVDISKQMLSQTRNCDKNLHYLHIRNAKIPILNNSYDLVFSCFVLFTVPSKARLRLIFDEANRCLNSGGIFIVVTGSESLYSQSWLSYDTDFSENKELFSGKKLKIKLRDLNIKFTNYYWSDVDYTELFQSSNFQIIEKHFPLGKIEDGFNWISETKISPYIIYVAKKHD